ncbi:MAG: acyl-[acyl-carrier-protein]--UDP-N-acetylglucosamine O-acyltransferase [Planctomycetaceae bacterium]|nr:acyl-[acyl-carrier-protein]--UDP-N-acetylglucosamine O-acyltransferase [Planctomycetaceae bacterium]
MIHPSAIISSQAEIAPDAEIGPFCIVEAGTQIGSGCRLVANVSVRTGTVLGSESTVYEGAILGGLPQIANQPTNPGNLVIGKRNVLREHCTLHRAIHEGNSTTLGDDCLLMVGAHVAHDCQVGNHVILTNGAMLGGHVEIGDRACLGGNSAVHQFCRIGRLVMVGACTKVVQDIPPFVLTDGATALIVGLNRVGLRRAGLSRQEILDLKAAYRLIYRHGLSFQETLQVLQEQFPTGVASEFATFFQGGERGFVQERRSPPRIALRVHPAVDEIDEEESSPVPRRLAG